MLIIITDIGNVSLYYSNILDEYSTNIPCRFWKIKVEILSQNEKNMPPTLGIETGPPGHNTRTDRLRWTHAEFRESNIQGFLRYLR